MITQLSVQRFKCFGDLALPFQHLTVLTGRNGTGKTSVIHALLLARLASTHAQTVSLNGPYGLALGEASDVLTLDADPSHGIALTIQEEGEDYRWRFSADEGIERCPYLRVAESPATSPLCLSGSNRVFSYLTAERLGPRDVVDASAEPADELGVGYAGQYSTQVLAVSSKLAVPEGRRHPQQTEIHGLVDLHHQSEWWLSSIVREVEIRAEWHPGTSVVSLRFRSPGFRSEWTRPSNTGFGLSYALPVVVAGLFAPPGGLLIVENPEAHLHPAGQLAIGRFLSCVAADGVQVLLETHSDHVLNGIRLSVHDAVIKPDRVALCFFENDARQRSTSLFAPTTTVSTPRIDHNGRIDRRPDGFFDEWDKSLRMLLKSRVSDK